VPVQSAGISLRRLVAPILVLTGATVLVTGWIQESWIPDHREEIREARSLGRGKAFIRHVKYYDGKDRILVAMKRYFPKKLLGEGVMVFSPAGRGKRGFLIEARSAAWVEEERGPGRWMLEDATVQEYDEKGNLVPPAPGSAETSAIDPAAGRLYRTHEKVALDRLAPVVILPTFLQEREIQEPFTRFGEILRLARESKDSYGRRLLLILGSRVVDPLHSMILVLLGIPIILSKGTRNIFLSAISITFVSSLYFITYLIFLNLGNRGTLPPGLAVGLPPLAFGALGITLYARMPS
jgi:lipopolysaccharide export LptBFGC system permease protein LptF